MSLIGSLVGGGQSAAQVAAAVGGADLAPLPVVSPFGAGAVAWPTANLGMFVKFRVGRTRTATGLWVFNGAPSGNAKVALYASDGTTLTQVALSASTALAGTNDGQQIPFATPYAGVAPHLDWHAFLVLDNGTATLLRATLVAGNIALDLGLCGTVASAFATPPATQAISGLGAPSSGYVPVLAVY